MPIAWHPSRWWDWSMPEDDKKEIKSCGKMVKEKVCSLVSIRQLKRLSNMSTKTF